MLPSATCKGNPKFSMPSSGVENGEKGGGGGLIGVDNSALASAISNGEDLGPFIRMAFEIRRPEYLIHQLKGFVKKKEVEIEDMCKLHYSKFIRAFDELRHVLLDADELKSRLAKKNKQLQLVGDGLLTMLDSLIESHGTKKNLMGAINSLKICTVVVDLCMKMNDHVLENGYYLALKALDIGRTTLCSLVCFLLFYCCFDEFNLQF